jgi:pimeloyl-ACP methyl ester carboxylesterase
MGAPSYAVIPGAGSAGYTWRDVAGELGALVLPIPDEPEVQEMARALAGAIAELPAPRVLIGASMGAMVALEVARSVEIEALVLASAGFGIEVSDRLIGWMERNPPDLFRKMAKICLGDREDPPLIDAIVADYIAGGHAEHVRHLQALSRYAPEQLREPPPTIVLWGMRDPAVPLEGHVELALRCRGALVPIADAAHVPFLEQPQVTLEWIRRAARLSDGPAAIDRDHLAGAVGRRVGSEEEQDSV